MKIIACLFACLFVAFCVSPARAVTIVEVKTTYHYAPGDQITAGLGNSDKRFLFEPLVVGTTYDVAPPSLLADLNTTAYQPAFAWGNDPKQFYLDEQSLQMGTSTADYIVTPKITFPANPGLFAGVPINQVLMHIDSMTVGGNSTTIQATYSFNSPVPEPSSLALIVLTICGVWSGRYRGSVS